MHARLAQKEKRYLDRARVTRVSSVDGRANRTSLPSAMPSMPRGARPISPPRVSPHEICVDARPRRWTATTTSKIGVGCVDWWLARERASWAPGPELDRAVRLLKKKYKQYRDYDFDETIALRTERVNSWGL